MQQPPNPLPTIPFDPLEDRVVILPLDAESKTKGGIVIPDTAKDKPVKGVVLAAGPGKFSDKPIDSHVRLPDGSWGECTSNTYPMPVKRGDLVVYPMWAGEKFPQAPGEPELRILRAGEVLGVLHRDTKPENVPVDLVEVQS